MAEIHFQTTRTHQEPDRLAFALFLAIALHSLIIFGVGFSYLKPRPAATALDITLAHHASSEEIDNADYIAQANQQGSGNITDDKNAITTDQLSDYSADVLRDTNPAQPIQTAQATPVMTERTLTTDKQSRLVKVQTSEDGERESTDSETAPPPTPMREFSSLQAQLDMQKQAYSKQPKILRLTTASTRQADHAEYLKYWIDKVELTGNRHYPDEARRRKLFGELRLAVTVLPDGSIESVEILQGSKHRILDQAAVETVRRASPFAAFPEEMSQWDKIEVIQTWRFLPENYMQTE